MSAACTFHCHNLLRLFKGPPIFLTTFRVHFSGWPLHFWELNPPFGMICVWRLYCIIWKFCFGRVPSSMVHFLLLHLLILDPEVWIPGFVPNANAWLLWFAPPFQLAGVLLNHKLIWMVLFSMTTRHRKFRLPIWLLHIPAFLLSI